MIKLNEAPLSLEESSSNKLRAEMHLLVDQVFETTSGTTLGDFLVSFTEQYLTWKDRQREILCSSYAARRATTPPPAT